MGKLSNTQNTRLGGLIAVLSGREPYEHILGGLLADGFVKATDGAYMLTEKGMKEKDRLATLAGLMVEKDYAAPLPQKHQTQEPASRKDYKPTHTQESGQQNITQGQPSFDTKNTS